MSVELYDGLGGIWHEDGTPTEDSLIQEPIQVDSTQSKKPTYAQLEADLEERTHQFHLAEVKVMSRETIIEQLSESELAKDVTRLEAVLEKIKRAAMLYLEHGEPELADELEALLTKDD